MAKFRPVKAFIGSRRPSRQAYASEQDAAEAVRSATAMISDRLIALMNNMENLSPEIMMDALGPTYDKSQRYCPVDTGALKDSGYLEITSHARGRKKVEIGYAKNGSPWYAGFVHENLEMHHAAPTRAKWLESAVMEDLAKIERRLTGNYKAVFDNV